MSGGGPCNDGQVAGFDIGTTEISCALDDVLHLFESTLVADPSASGGCAQTTLCVSSRLVVGYAYRHHAVRAGNTRGHGARYHRR